MPANWWMGNKLWYVHITHYSLRSKTDWITHVYNTDEFQKCFAEWKKQTGKNTSCMISFTLNSWNDLSNLFQQQYKSVFSSGKGCGIVGLAVHTRELSRKMKDFHILALGTSQRCTQVSKLTELPNWTHFILYKLHLSDGYLKVQLQATIQ